MNTNDILIELQKRLANQEFVIDKSGVKTVEILSASFIADKPAIIGKPIPRYISAEISWYNSQSTNVKDIYGDAQEPPLAWLGSADMHGNINSNYGKLIYSDLYYNQYKHTLNELKANRDSRRAIMIYNRPSIWVEYNENMKSDFICTLANHFLIRNDTLVSIVNMRSNDVVFGYKNDYAWFSHVQENLAADLGIAAGHIHWNANSLHVYERHFELLREEPIHDYLDF